METDDYVHQHLANLNQAFNDTKVVSKIITEHKELHAPISKLGKLVEKVHS